MSMKSPTQLAIDSAEMSLGEVISRYSARIKSQSLEIARLHGELEAANQHIHIIYEGKWHKANEDQPQTSGCIWLLIRCKDELTPRVINHIAGPLTPFAEWWKIIIMPEQEGIPK